MWSDCNRSVLNLKMSASCLRSFENIKPIAFFSWVEAYLMVFASKVFLVVL